MKKIVIHSPGNHEKLALEEHPDLIPGPGEVVVNTRAAGVNYADVCVRWGVYESAKRLVGWPITPGFEFSGIVGNTGPDVTRFKSGDRVFGITFFNGYASQICVPEKQLYTIPDRFSLEEAAGFPAVFMTAYHALFQLVRIPEGASILIHSAGGGVGSALVQLARARGFSITGVVGSPHKVSYVKSLGAHHVIDKSSADLWTSVRSVCPNGYDAVLDANGPETLRGSYTALRATGKLIVYGSHGILPQTSTGRMNYLKAAFGLWKMPRFNPMDLITDNKSVIGFNLSFLFDRDDLLLEGMRSLLEMVEKGQLLPPKITRFDAIDAASAHRLIESGASTGKIVLGF